MVALTVNNVVIDMNEVNQVFPEFSWVVGLVEATKCSVELR